MDIRFAIGKNETKTLDTNGLRDNFLVSELFQEDKLKLTYSHYDRMIIGGVLPLPILPSCVQNIFWREGNWGSSTLGERVRLW